MPIVGGPFSSLYVGDAQATDRRPRTFRRAVSANSYASLTSATLNNQVSTPDSASLDITGDVEIVVRIAPTDYSNGGEQRILSKRDGASRGNYEIHLTATGAVTFSCNDGAKEGTSSSVLPYGNGVASWLKVEKFTSTGTIRFYHAADQTAEPTSWTQLGTDVASGAGALVGTADSLWIGSLGSLTAVYQGRIHRAIVRNGVGGTTVADFNPNLWVSGSTFTSTDGRVYTLNGTAAITKA